MGDELGASGDTLFREGGALQKLNDLSHKWHDRAIAAERSRRAHRLERIAWGVAGAGVALAVRYLLSR